MTSGFWSKGINLTATEMRKAGMKVDTQGQEVKNEIQPLIGQRLTALRLSRQMTQEDLADKMGVSRQAISKWESDRTLPNVEKLFCLSELYQVSLDYLLTGKEKQLPDAGAGTEIRKGFCYIRFAVILLGILLFINCAWIIKLLFYQNWNQNKEAVNYYVDTIYEQYTKAKIVIPREDGSFTEQMVWLDRNGVRENDWGWCYNRESFFDSVKLNYKVKTLVVPMVTAGVLFCLLLILCLEMRKNYETKRK